MNAPFIPGSQTITATVVETSTFSGTSTISSATQPLVFTDVGTDVSPEAGGDFHGLIITPLSTGGFGLPLGILNATITNDATGPADPNGTVSWSFSIENGLIDYLAQGEPRTERFEIKIVDANGNFATEIIAITITGSNDGPVFTSPDATLDFIEGAGAALSDAGSFAFDDLDISQDGSHVVDFTVASVAGTGDVESRPSASELEGFFSATLDQTGTDNNTGKAAWSFAATDSHFDYLGSGETLIITYRVAVSDGDAPPVTRDVTVTITGTNDTVTLSAETGALNDTSANDTLGPIDGAVDIADLDVTDDHSFSVSGGNPDEMLEGFDHSATGEFGTLYYNSDTGAYRYIANETLVEALKENDQDVFDVMVDDDNGDTDSNTLTINITATNDAADITGTFEGAVVEAGGVDNGTTETPTASGNLNYTDRDDAPDAWSTSVPTQGQYGTLTIEADGQWSYALDNDNATVQGLKASSTPLTDTITVTTSDGTPKNIVITITGTNDAAVVTGVDEGAVTEAGGINDATNPIPGISGNLGHTDVDAADEDDVWLADEIDGDYGTLTIDAAGAWTYTLDNSKLAVKAIDDEGTLTDDIIVSTSGGTPHTITITINGSNDAPVVTAITGTGTNEDGEANTQALSHSGTFEISDEDGGDTLEVSVAAATVAYSGGAIPDAGLAALLGAAGNIIFDPAEADSNNGDPTEVTWDYTVSSANLDFLRADETLTITYTVMVFDGTDTTTRPLAITITGTNDAPTISAASIAVTTIVEAGAAVAGVATVSGDLSDADANWTDLDKTEDAALVVTKGSSGAAAQTGLAFDGMASGATTGEAAINGTYGTLYLKADGTYRYVLDNARTETQAL